MIILDRLIVKLRQYSGFMQAFGARAVLTDDLSGFLARDLSGFRPFETGVGDGPGRSAAKGMTDARWYHVLARLQRACSRGGEQSGPSALRAGTVFVDLGSNLDEFYMMRIAGLQEAAEGGITVSSDAGLSLSGRGRALHGHDAHPHRLRVDE